MRREPATKNDDVDEGGRKRKKKKEKKHRERDINYFASYSMVSSSIKIPTAIDVCCC